MKRARLTPWVILISFALVGLVPFLLRNIGSGGEGLLWARVIGSLLFSLLLAAGAAFALRSRFRGTLVPLNQGERRLRLIETLRISHQTDLYLIELDGRRLLVAASAAGPRLLVDCGEEKA